jgi:Zn-dependent protease with chaperone function
VAPDRTLNGMCVGMSKPFVVVHHGAVELLDDDEMRVLLGHELGHLMSGHAVYRTMIIILTRWITSMAWLPIGSLVLRAIVIALMEWWRKAELSSDRAGLLATQDPATAFRVHMKLASGSGDLSELDQTSFFAQGQEYLDASDLRDSVLKLVLIERAPHPYAVVRAAELRNWVDSGEYTQILSGTYPRRDEDDAAKVSEAAKEAADSYTQSFSQTQDALGKLVHDVAGFLGSAKVWIDEQLRRTRD